MWPSRGLRFRVHCRGGRDLPDIFLTAGGFILRVHCCGGSDLPDVFYLAAFFFLASLPLLKLVATCWE